MLSAIKLVSFLIAFSISMALPISFCVNKCDDATEYYTTTKIINYSILYSITTHDNKTQLLSTKQLLYNNPTFENYLELTTSKTNITLRAKVIFEYEILTPCYYTCAMEIFGNEYISKNIAKHIETYYQPGRQYPMMCNSYGCRASANYCKTFQSYDEI